MKKYSCKHNAGGAITARVGEIDGYKTYLKMTENPVCFGCWKEKNRACADTFNNGKACLFYKDHYCNKPPGHEGKHHCWVCRVEW